MAFFRFSTAYARRLALTRALISIGFLTVYGSSEAAKSPPSAAFVQEVTEACLNASNLHKPKPAGKLVEFDDQIGMMALLVDGQVMLNRTKSRKGRVLCLFDKVTRNPFIAEARSLAAGFR